jgi:hypothetical protein
MTIEVRVAGRGSMRDGKPKADSGTSGRCDLCGRDADVVASVSPDASTFACKPCLRDRLDAMTVAAWTLKEGDSTGLPWGKFSG